MLGLAILAAAIVVVLVIDIAALMLSENVEYKKFEKPDLIELEECKVEYKDK